MQATWTYTTFSELSAAALYAIMRLRNEVFVVEQQCVYQDADNKDEQCFHLALWIGDELVAYCRILPPGLSYTTPGIGRVVNSPAYRTKGYGRMLMQKAITTTLQQFNLPTITISAQLYLSGFYTSLGFVQVSEMYLEDNIPHIEMIFTA